jgi:hypothetical protein
MAIGRFFSAGDLADEGDFGGMGFARAVRKIEAGQRSSRRPSSGG